MNLKIVYECNSNCPHIHKESSCPSHCVPNLAKAINKNKPTLLQGYSGGVYEFALFLKDKHLKIHAPKAVWVTSAPLPEAQRQVMQEVFGAPVYDQFGTCEVMWLSAECKQQKGMPMMSDTRHIEFVNESNDPVPDCEWGRILLTDLYNYAFPLISHDRGKTKFVISHLE